MLPPALLDLTLLRLTTPASSTRLTQNVSNGIRRARKMHQAALATGPPPPPFHFDQHQVSQVQEHSNSKNKFFPAQFQGQSVATYRENPASHITVELERRVKALEVAATAEVSSSEGPSYTEEELMYLYEDVLALTPQPDKKAEMNVEELLQSQIKDDLALVYSAEQRLLSLHTEDVTPEHAKDRPPSLAYKRVLQRANDLISRLELAREKLKLSPNGDIRDSFVPLTVLSAAEYQSLFRTSIRTKDSNAAELTFDLMKRSGFIIPTDLATTLMEIHAWAGHVDGVESIIANYLIDPPTAKQRNLHVKAHLRSTPSESIPIRALEVLHSYESKGHPAPIQSYTSAITSLFSTNSSIGRAQAWDLFSHMRYVAHPNPDVPLYTLMIRACASPLNTRPSEPEKALDFWTEMTIDQRLTPTAGAYDAIILACARSGKTMYVNEAFRLAKQMLDAYRDARGESAFRPSRRTFCALLEGAKRVGDLTRARWILAQMIAEQKGIETEAVNEEVMMHVFHAYVSYRPPLQRGAVRSVSGTSVSVESETSTSRAVVPSTTTESQTQETGMETFDRPSSFTHIPPQSRAEVINEAKILFNRILYDTGLKVLSDHSEDSGIPLQQQFQFVRLTPRLVNSYLSVYYKHSSLETARDLYQNLFRRCNVPRISRTYVEALEKCAIVRRGHERLVALDFAAEVWAEWQKLEEIGQETGRELSGRTIEKAYVAMIRVLSLAGHTDQAMQHLRAFVTRYPPSDLRNPTPKPLLRSTRTTLVGARPLVRLTSSVEVPDDRVPPLIMFDDVEILHHRLVAKGARSEIAYLSWACKAYEGSLRMRRDAALRMPPNQLETRETPLARLSSPAS